MVGAGGAGLYLCDTHGIGPERQLCIQGDSARICHTARSHAMRALHAHTTTPHLRPSLHAYAANEAVAKHYRNKLVGDTPEFCPLDSNLLSDYEFGMKQNLAYTYWLPHDHPKKFLSGTPKHVQQLMEATWAHDGAVTSKRIVEDICRFPAALDDIIAAKGAKVEHLDNRKGRRKAKPYHPPRIEEVEELLKARFEGFDPTPVLAADAALPPKKRRLAYG